MQHPSPTISLPTPAPRNVTGRYRVAIESLTHNGESEGRVVETIFAPSAEEFVQVYGQRWDGASAPARIAVIGGLPGEIVDVDLVWSLPRADRRRARRTPAPLASVHAVIVSASERVTAPCPVFGACGGCQLQHMSYPAQLMWKAERVRQALSNVGFPELPVTPTLGLEPPWGYRNHMRFSVNRSGQAGLTVRGSHRVLPLTNCPIAHPAINTVLESVADQPLQRPQLLARYGESTRQMIIQPEPPSTVTDRLTQEGIELRTGDMEETLGGERFRIRPSSFFQTNTRQANRMAQLVIESLPSGQNVTLVDAYCGVGTFARLLAQHAGTVIAIEESASAIRDAGWNLRDLPNTEIVQGKVENILPLMTRQLDGLVIDPPRAGCQRPVLDALIARRVPRVVYVSCNPDTLARDLAYLCLKNSAYRVASTQPLDMFPQTAHIETIATLEAI